MLSFNKPKSQPVCTFQVAAALGYPLGIWSRSFQTYGESDQTLQIGPRHVSYPPMLSKGAAIICPFLILSGLSSQHIRTLVIIPLQQARSQRIVLGRDLS